MGRTMNTEDYLAEELKGLREKIKSLIDEVETLKLKLAEQTDKVIHFTLKPEATHD